MVSDIKVASKYRILYNKCNTKNIPFDLTLAKVKQLLNRKTCYYTRLPLSNTTMKIKELISQHRRDFTALMECEHCGHEQMNHSGYDDRYYHDHVIPEMKCTQCGESTLSKGGEITRTATRYAEGYQV